MKFLPLILIFLSVQIFAKDVELKINSTSSKDGVSKIAVSTMVVTMDKKFEIPFLGKDSLKIKLITSQDLSKTNFPNESKTNDLILFNGEFYSLENGVEKLVVTPEIITKIGEKATMMFESEKGMFEIELIATKVL
jgi:hypothetical protein